MEKTPDNTATVGSAGPSTHEAPSQESQSRQTHAVTYRELNKKTNTLAYILQSRGVKPGTIVAIMLERSIEMIIGLLGILKAGCAYLPIEPTYPEKRINYMLKDSNAGLLLVDDKSEIRISKFEINPNGSKSKNQPSSSFPNNQYPITNTQTDGPIVLNLEHLALRHIEAELDSDFEVSTSDLNLKASGIAYVIYTSGTTGRPKGVLIEHSSVNNLAISQAGRFKIDASERIMQFSSISFDASVEQIFISLFNGAALVLVDKETLLESAKFNDYVNKQAVTHLHAVPSFLATLEPTKIPRLRRVLSGGAVCPPGLAGRWIYQCDFYNRYGPTETTVTSIELLVKEDHLTTTSLTIGKPMANTRVFILDKNRKLVP
ncbi:MAG: amino acid adenylation domain-containing protein, partial [bacterium]|nr:amino acid adenylation domain-containing protein [bacterium]